MDYEKEYYEIVRRARELHESGNELTKKQMEIVCPQLAESEDERIRKHIIEILERLSPCHWIGNEKSECIAYLEKQKEPLTPEEKMNHPLYLEGFDVGRRVGEVVAKPAEWSEEDERNINTLISVIKAYYNEYDLVREDYPINARELCEWLKFLRPQPHWKPSEEQMEILGRFNDPMLKSLYSDLQKLL